MLCERAGCHGCEIGAHIKKCSCANERKLPTFLLKFLLCQRNRCADVSVEEIQAKSQAVLQKERDKEDERRGREYLARLEDERKNKFLEDLEAEDQDQDDDWEDVDEDDPDWEDQTLKNLGIKITRGERNTSKMSLTIMMIIKYALTNRAAAALISAVLIDWGIADKSNVHQLVDHKKVWRARQAMMRYAVKKRNDKCLKISSLYIDGKIDSTLTVKESTGGIIKQERDHYVMVTQPGDRYLGHYTSFDKGKGKSIKLANQACDTLTDWNVDISGLLGVGGDTTAPNTGNINGLFTTIEKRLNRRLQWLCCLLHVMELPPRKLVEVLVGKSTGPGHYQGPSGIGPLLRRATALPLNQKFKKICIGPGLPSSLTPAVIAQMTPDQKYLLRIVKMIRSGVIDWEIIDMEVGGLCQSRWLTCCCRICRLWVSVHHLSAFDTFKLQLMVEYVVGCYTNTWMEIKMFPSWINGADHTLNLITRLRLMNPIVQEIIKPCIQNGAWYAHEENLLPSLLLSDNPEEVTFAIKKIEEIRGGNQLGDAR